MVLSLDFEHKRALITGATGHIGSAFCKEFANLGGSCILVDRDKNSLSDLIYSLKKNSTGEHYYFVADLLDAESKVGLITELNKHFGSIDILINNAAFTGDTDLDGWCVPFSDQSLATWESAMKVNLTSSFEFVQGLLPLLEAGKDPCVINVASIYGFIAPDLNLYKDTEMGNPLAYAASKGGLLQMTRWLASVLAPKIRVNAVSPGGIYRGQPDKFVERYKEKTPLNRMACEEDVVASLVFLASGMASYITGHNLIVDGGYSLR